ESKGYTYEKLATANAIRYQVRDSTINVDNLLDVLDKEAAGGHGWIRHGSDVTDEELKERLTGKKDRNGAEADTMGQPSSKFKDLASYKKMLDRSETILETKIKKSITDLKPKIVKYESDKKNFQSAPKNTREKTDKNTIMDTSKQAMETEIASLENDHIEFDKNPQQPNQVKLSKKYSIEQQDSDNLAKAFTPGTTLALDTNDYKFAYTKWIGMPGTKVQDLNDGDESSQSHKMETNFPEKAAINSGRLNKVTKAG
ncbi:MAG: hypothetical protein M0P13_05615, partial [Fibrobacteraceae bacterium]|nr:hypothetical protein [Fibrobacteraceae bacterium]